MKKGNRPRNRRKALLLPVDGPPRDVLLDGTYRQLEALLYEEPNAPEYRRKTRLIEPIRLYEEPHREPSERHGFTDTDARPGRIVAYVAAQGKIAHEINPRATRLLADDLFPFDHVHGALLLCGVDPATGQHIDLPSRARRFEALS